MGLSLNRLLRLQRIRSLQEQQARMDLERANNALHAAETALAGHQQNRVDAQSAARGALLAGDRIEWHLAEAGREVSEWKIGQMEVLRKQRAEAVAPARALYMEKRREEEQIKILRAGVQSDIDVERKREEQRMSDEWFAQRQYRGEIAN
jgi:flagellar biosynthesis chaperone FliJ